MDQIHNIDGTYSFGLNHSSTLTTAKYYARITPDIERGLIKQYVESLMG